MRSCCGMSRADTSLTRPLPLFQQNATRGRGEAHWAESVRLRAQGRDTPKVRAHSIDVTQATGPQAPSGRARRRLRSSSPGPRRALAHARPRRTNARASLPPASRPGRRGLHALVGLALPAAEQLVEEAHRFSCLAGTERRVSQSPRMGTKNADPASPEACRGSAKVRQLCT